MNRRMSPARFATTALLAGVLVLLATAAYNYQANRWGIFAEDYQTFHRKIRPNRHWMKTDFLISEAHDYDCILFGSSRVGSIDARRLEGNCYNFTHSGGLPSNHLVALKTFLAHGLPLKRIYLGLDDISYQWNPADTQAQHLRRGYPADLFDQLDAYVFYLLRPIELRTLGLVTGATPRQPIPEHVVDPVADWQRIDRQSQVYYSQPEKQNDNFRMLDGTVAGGAYYGEKAVRDLKEFVELAENAGIAVTLFFNPLHYKTYLTRNYDNYLDFKRRVADVRGFFDFTGLNPYSTDNRYWRETSHYTSIVGNRITDILAGEAATAEGFGRRVTAENLQALESAQVAIDEAFLEPLLQREGLLGMPARFVSLWEAEGRLQSQPVKQPRDEENRALVAGGEILLARGSQAADYRPGVWTRLQEGDYFVLHFRARTAAYSKVDVMMRQAPGLVGGDWRSYRLYLQEGDNSGFVAGHVSHARTPLRLRLERGIIDQHWQALELYTLRPAERTVAQGAQ